jgi:hypothetical protein
VSLLVQVMDFAENIQFAFVVLDLSLREKIYGVVVGRKLISLEELDRCLVELEYGNLMEELKAFDAEGLFLSRFL